MNSDLKALILDTETHDLNGLPIEIAYVPVQMKNGDVSVYADQAYDQYFSVGQPISFGAMAVHHILETDIAGKPSYQTFRLPEGVEYVIGHNIDYDIEAIAKCGVDISGIKTICTLALARHAWPEVAHNVSALIYMLFNGNEIARNQLRNAHNAKQDVLLTGSILKSLVRVMGVTDLKALHLASLDARIPKIMPFGKYAGVEIKKIPADYKAWLLNKPDVDPYLRKALEG